MGQRTQPCARAYRIDHIHLLVLVGISLVQKDVWHLVFVVLDDVLIIVGEGRIRQHVLWALAKDCFHSKSFSTDEGNDGSVFHRYNSLAKLTE